MCSFSATGLQGLLWVVWIYSVPSAVSIKGIILRSSTPTEERKLTIQHGIDQMLRIYTNIQPKELINI